MARLQELSAELDLAARGRPGRRGRAPPSAAADPPVGDLEVSGVTIDDVRELVVDALGPDHPLLDWLDDLPPIVADAIEASDELAATVGNVIQAGRAMRRTPVPTLASVRGGHAPPRPRRPGARPLRRADLERRLVVPLARRRRRPGRWRRRVYFGAALCGLFGWLAATARMSPSQRDDFERRYDPDTGETTFPSGSAHSPHLDVAGVPLDPAYG